MFSRLQPLVFQISENRDLRRKHFCANGDFSLGAELSFIRPFGLNLSMPFERPNFLPSDRFWAFQQLHTP